MGKKIYYTLCLTVCLLLAVSVSAFAGEVPELVLPEIAPAVFRAESEPAFSLFSGEAQPESLAWDEDSTCYRDQLAIYCDTVLGGNGTALYLYNDLVEAFEADWNEEKRLEIETLTFETNLDCWVAHVLTDKVWDVEWYKAQYEGLANLDGQIMEYWRAMIKVDMADWYNEQLETLPELAWLAASAFTSDHPEYFWVRGDGGINVCEYVDDENEIYISEIVYGFLPKAGCETLEKRVALQEEIEEVVADLQEQTSGMTPVQKITYWDNWLAEQNAYNHDALASGLEASSHPWSIVSGLLPGYDPVCEGYAKALQLLCKWSTEEVEGIKIDASIPCVQLSGGACGDMTADPQKWEPHMWLAIQMEDGKWYYCDPTWNDPTINIVDQFGNVTGQEEHSYSSREHLLTVQPEDHQVYNVEQELGTPALSPVSYFVATETTVEETMNTWTATNDSFTGMEIGSGAMMIVLYDENGKMLDLGFCEKGTQWGENEWLYLAPVFDAEDLAQATRIVRINVGDTTAWSPLNGQKTIRGYIAV